MLDAVYEWIKNLAFYLVIMTAVLEVLPGDTYKKYIRFFAGLVLILLVITPVLKLTGSFQLFQETYQRKEQELQADIEEQKELFEKTDAFDFLSETYSGVETESHERETGLKAERKRLDGLQEKKTSDDRKINVEEIRIGEVQRPDMESDTYRE